jgi:glutathione synthase/RimK-type ligase-like ATP-grasp enzyme
MAASGRSSSSRYGVCFVTCRRWPEISESDQLALQALERGGVAVAARAWNDAGASFDDFDAVILRSNWDYHFDLEGFVAWLDRWETAGARIWNPPALVRWNLSKRYLLDLDDAGISVVPTVILDDAPSASLSSVMVARGWSQAVVKPMVSASAHDTVLVAMAEAATVERALDEGRIRRPAVVQPFVPEVRRDGEWSLIFVDGVFTHAVRKRPAPDDFRVQPRFGGKVESAVPAATTLLAARRVLDALPRGPLYARIDGVRAAAGFLVMEVEVNEPGLFFTYAPAAAERFAEAICRRLSA